MRILFCSDSFPGRFGVLASALASAEHEVLFASHYGRRDFAIPGVHRVLLKPVREASALKRTLTAARQAYTAFLSLRASGFTPDAVLFASSSAIPIWAHAAFPEARLFGYVDTPVHLEAHGESRSPELPANESRQAAMLRLASLAHCRAVFTFSEVCMASLPPLFRSVAKALPSFTDTEFFSPEAAQPFSCAGLSFPKGRELVTMDVHKVHGASALEPRAVWELALGLLAHCPQSFILLCCATPELKEASEAFAARLPANWQSRLAVQGYRSLENWRDMLSASTLFVLPEPCCSAGGVISPEALEALSCGTPVAAPLGEGQNILRGMAMVGFDPASMKDSLARLCGTLDAMRKSPVDAAAVRQPILESYSPRKRLPSHIEELTVQCRG